MSTFELDDSHAALLAMILQSAAGTPLTLTRDGKSVARLVTLAFDSNPGPRRLGGMEGQFVIPEDFDRMCADEIEDMFYGKS